MTGSALEDLVAQAESPAAPAGLSQAAQTGAGYVAQQPGYEGSALGALVGEQGYVEAASSWYTGRNVEGEENGWNTEFAEAFVSGQNEAAAAGTLSTYFEDGGTGVVTWDHQSADGHTTYNFGDVVEAGKKTGNVFEQFDAPTANLMMSQWLFDGKQQARLFSEGDPTEAVAAAVEQVHLENNTNIPKALAAAEFNTGVQERALGWQDEAEVLAPLAAAGGGALTGAGVGATLTSWLGPGAAVGAIAGAGVGAAVGGIGGYLNRDELTEQAARAYEITALSENEFGEAAGTATKIKEWAGFTTQLTSPLTQLSHGLVELTGTNQVGDSKAGYYAEPKQTHDPVTGEVTETGGRPAWAKPLSLAATVGDSLMQFVSPMNRVIYASQMGGVIGGETAQLGLTGSMFDPREGGFDNIFVDDEGNADPVSAAAGIMKVGIDAIQVTGFLGLARASTAARRSTEAGEQVVNAAGMRFTVDASGKVLSRKVDKISILAPSESVAYASAARKARVLALADRSGPRVVSADDYYKAATTLAAGGSARLKAALVNGFGEGYEEFVQGVLEPIAMDGDLQASELREAFYTGVASGFGMSLGATFRSPSQDERLKSQAYVVETIRRDGVEPDWDTWNAEWDKASKTEKRVLASRNPADAKQTAQALKRLAESQAATLAANSDVDVPWLLDARRTQVERELARGLDEKVNAFHVMTGTIDFGRVDRAGNLLGDTVPAEAVQASALTIAKMLENRSRGLGLQVESLRRRLEELEARDQAAADVAEKVAETRLLLATTDLAHQVGQAVMADITKIVSVIYDESTTEAAAQQLNNELNVLISKLYNRRAPVAPPDGSTATESELDDAAAQFVTLLQSREPKLDTGSYVTLMPHASWDLTKTRSDNLVQVNTDILAAINGDFDGDKLRAENQMTLTPERYTQARAGQLLGGRGESVDIAVREWDQALTKAVGGALVEANSQLNAEAKATIANIMYAVNARYPKISPAQLDRVRQEFTTAVRAGSEEARTTLLDALAREAGEIITEVGRAVQRNEWLWISQVVRANFAEFHSSYRRLRTQSAIGPSDTTPVLNIDTPTGTNRRKTRATTDAQTLALFAEGSTLFRMFQKIHYSSYGASVLSAAGVERSDLFEYAKFYAELSRGVTRDELSRTQANDAIGARVLAMLARLVDDAMADPEFAGKFSPAAAMTVLANVKVKDVWWDRDGEPETNNEDISLVQLLLKRALEADRLEHKATFETDQRLQAKHARLGQLTRPNAEGQINAERAFVEVFSAVPFSDALGGNTGALAPNLTPEQWLRGYISHDQIGRRAMEREFTLNVPEYLDRAQTQNLPYSLFEAMRREVTPYRSMMDAMMAVGRSELTFDPTTPMRNARKALGGRRADISHGTSDAFMDGHQTVRQALLDYRKLFGRTGNKLSVESVQEMIEQNPQFGRLIRDMIPKSAANAVAEYRDGRLYIAPFIYEMFTIENPREALFYYWKHLTLAQWNSTQVNVHEDDDDAPGRAYNKLQSRFQRLMYQLAREPGQPHLEQLVRKMDELKDLDQFFLWLNKTPGFRGEQAPLLPWHDDVAEFEADAGGGWVTSRASGDIRAAVIAMHSGSVLLRETLSFRAEKAAHDKVLRDSIRRALHGDPAATDLDRTHLRQFEKALAISQQLPRGFAPSAMLALTRGAVRSFDPHSHDKGITADSYQPLGEFQALMDAFAFVPGLERVMETLTAHSISSLRINLGDLVKTSGAAMDADGQQVSWSPMSVDDALEMMDDPRTAPLAYALLTPKALDITQSNGLTERVLFEASLADLLDDTQYKDLFKLDGDDALDNAMRYLSLLDSYARSQGGHFDVMRYVNQLIVARTSGLKQEVDDPTRMVQQAYLDVARWLQTVGQIQSTPNTRDSGLLAQARDVGVGVMHGRSAARKLSGFTDEETGLVTESWVKLILTELEIEAEQLRQEAHDSLTGPTLNKRLETIQAQYDTNAARVNAALDSNIVESTVQRFAITGDPAQDQSSRVQIISFVKSMTSFPHRSGEPQLAADLIAELQDGRTPGDDFDWATLSRAAMGVYLADQVMGLASHVTIPPFPKGDPLESDSRFYKYKDPTFSYLADDAMQEDSAMTAGAVWLHTLAEQPRTTLTVDEITGTLKRTILNDQSLGSYTEGIFSQQVEVQQRMDSAAAGQAIAAAGNGPKRWAAVAAATRRTARIVPTLAQATTLTTDGSKFAESSSIFDEVDVTVAGWAAPTRMPVAQLDNRFFTALRVDGVDVPLYANNLGYTWDGESTSTGYRYVALPRLRRVLARLAQSKGVPMGALQVEIDFFHPDSKPEGDEWANNVYFDGMSHQLLPDGSESLIAALWSDNGGQIGVDTQRPLDAGKKGTRAIEPFTRVDAQQLADAEALWPDMAAMLRRKTELAMPYIDDVNAPDPSNFNSVYKVTSLHHIVAGRVNGKPAAMTAAEVIAFQAVNGVDAPLPMMDARLVKLSPDVVRTMLGDTGDQAAARFFDDAYLVNPDMVREFTTITPQMLDRFGEGWLTQGTLRDTDLVNTGAHRVMRVRTLMTNAERNARSDHIQFLAATADEVKATRYLKLKDTDARKGFLNVLKLAKGSVSTERNTFDFGGMGLPLGPREVTHAEHTNRLLEAMQDVEARDSYERGWVLSDTGEPKYVDGLLTVESMDTDRPLEHRVVLGDVVLLQLNTFERPGHDPNQVNARIEKALKYLVNTGATIILGSGNGGSNLRFEASEYLRDHGYGPVAGSRHFYSPEAYVQGTQNERAQASTFLETGRLTPARHAVTLLAIDPIGTDENNAIVNPVSTKLRDRKLVNNILTSAQYINYGMPVDDNRDDGAYVRALNHLITISDPAQTEHRDMLVAMAGPDPAGVLGIEEALDRFHEKIANRGSLVPVVGDEVKRGDIIPLLHPDGRVILYRHGMKVPRPHEVRDLQDASGINVALAQSKTEPAATANDGYLRSVEPRAGYGKTWAIEIAEQLVGSKVQVEDNGMKYTLVLPTGGVVANVLETPVFANGTVVDLMSNYKAVAGKEATGGVVNNLRNALTFFQFDFTNDVTEFFFPGEGNDPTKQVLTLSLLKRLQKYQPAKIPASDANMLAKARIAVADVLGDFAATEAENGVEPGWVDRLPEADEASHQIAVALITYLMTEGANLDNVLASAGFSHPEAMNTAVTVRQVPGLFADLLDHGFESAVHEELRQRFDSQFLRTPQGAGLRLNSNWTVTAFDGKGDSLVAWLQFSQVHSSGDNPVTDGQAFDETEKESVSSHNAMAGSLSIGGITAHKLLEKSRAFARSFSKGGGVTKLGQDGESLWNMLTALPNEKDSTFVGWRRETPAETRRRRLAREEQVGFYHPLNREGWSPEELGDYETAAAGVLTHLNLFGTETALVDSLVRDFLGRPYELDENGVERGIITAADAIQTVKTIRTNVRDGLLPHAGAMSPLIDVNHLTAIYRENVNRPDGWAPIDPKTKQRAVTWDDWVNDAFGTAWIMPADSNAPPEPRFDPIYLLAVDGRMHGYQNATASTRYLPVSSDILRQRQLIDPETNRQLVSTSADENLLATDPTLFNASVAGLDEIIGGQRIYSNHRDGYDPSSAQGKQKKRIDRWRAETATPRSREVTMRGVRQGGQTFIGHTTTTSSMWRCLINLRVGNALFNPALVISAPIEAFYRRTIDTLSDALAGESVGKLGQVQARWFERFEDTTIGAIAQALGTTPTYTADELQRLNLLVGGLSSRAEFKAMVYKELMFQYPSMPGIGKVEKWLERYAKFGARIQDPAWGMLPKDLARIYVKTVMRRISADPTGENIYSTERLLAEMARNPEWLRTNDLETHNMAIAAIANVRSVKPNVLSLGLRGIIEPLSERPAGIGNHAGNMLKMLTVFQNFWSNSVINMAGLQGASDFAAFWLDGRRKSNLTRRMQSVLSGQPYVPDTAEFYDMSEAIEGLDLADSFIRGGVTHTALFTLGMLAGNLGLSGEDDEEKWRRRQAELQGAGAIRDPRKLQNDFRNRDALFLDWLPLGLDDYFRADPNDPESRSLAGMNWVLRYFASPIIGFERFYNTGDFSEIISGFADALGSHPIVNAQLWKEATDTAAELHAASNDAIEHGDMEAGGHFLITAVGVLERMVMENSFVNAVYVGTDRYDRDPYAQPRLDSDNIKQVDVRGNPYGTDTLRQWVDDKGTEDTSDDEVLEGYIQRDVNGATLRTFTENRFGLALVGSLMTGITGGGFTSNDLWRQNMPVKERKIELLPTDNEALAGTLARTFMEQGGQVNLTEGEAAQLIKKYYQDRDIWWDAEDVEKQAATMAAQSGMAALAAFDDSGEVLTLEGQRAVLEGLRKGYVALGDPSLNGVFMSMEQRELIRDEMIVDLVQEGVDLGFTKDQATWRMRRIMYGTNAPADAPKLNDLIFTDQIPYSDTIRYNQLNTTFVIGPDGRPYATGFTRDGLMGALGVKPVNRVWTSKDTGLGMDDRLNVVDNIVGINTGLRAVEPRGESWEIPSIEDVTKQAAEDIIDAIKDIDFSPTEPHENKSGTGFGYGGYGGYRSRRGGGGGYSGGGYSQFTRMYGLPNSITPYGNSIPFINTSNPILRRGDVRRERVWSERGRLKQWQ